MRRKIFGTLLILLFLFATIPSLSSAEDDNRSYSISSGNIQVYIGEDGLLHMEETYTYHFSGTYNGVYRDIPLKNNESLENINVTTEGAYSRFEVLNEDDNTKRIKIYLYSDSDLKNNIHDRTVNVKISYDMINVITLFNDIGSLHLKLWGEQWEVPAESLSASIHFKSKEGVKYWFNPPYFVESESWDNSTLNVETSQINSGNYFEIRSAIPLNQFNTNKTFYGLIIDENGLGKIEKIQNDYQESLDFKNTFYPIVGILMLLTVFIPIGAYLKFGREPKIQYSALYEREPPTNDSPVFVNSIVGKGLIGTPNMDGFQATIMDLINRKYISILAYDKEDSISKTIQLKINHENTDELENFEKSAISILEIFKQGEIIDLHYMSNSLTGRETARIFKEKYDNWVKNVENKYFSDEKLEKFFISKGWIIMVGYGIVAIIIAFFAGIFTFLDQFPLASLTFSAAVLLLLFGIISLVLPQKVGGRWTEYGREYDSKWRNFKKYLLDYSLIKEYPPESIVIWNEYLVYASALGIAEKVHKVMAMNVPSDVLESSDIYIYHYYGGYALMATSFDTGISTANSSDSNGGVGGVGGGSGGGGGGAF